MKKLVGIVLLIILVTSMSMAKEARMLRYPDIHKDKIVFVFGGDLWIVSSAGGVANRLTSHNGLEMYPKFSPDGQYVAFTGFYDGNSDVFVVPTKGGEPKRLTFHPNQDNVLDWYPDSKHVLFRSSRNSPVPKYNRLFKVSIEGGQAEELPLKKAELSSLNADATKLAFNDLSRENRTWKRYRGGRAPDVKIYDFAANTSKVITDNKANNMFPMWNGEKVYFISDKDKAKDGREKFQLFEYDTANEETKRVTDFPVYDVQWPSMGIDKIIFQNGGWLYTYDLASGNTAKVTVEIFDDMRFLRPTLKSAQNYIHNFSLSPTGKRALFEARGDIFTVPAKKGETRNLTSTGGVRERNPVWSPNGKWIAYFADPTGEFQIYVRKADGSDEPRLVTEGLKSYLGNLAWSPDNKKIIYSDLTNTLYYVEIGSKKITKVFHDENNGTGNYVDGIWAPDSRWIAYDKNDPSGFTSIYIYSLEDGKTHRITGEMTSDNNPAFSPDGKYLFWSADRKFNPGFSAMEFNYFHFNPSRVVVATLQKDTPNPFAPESDEEKVKEEKKAEEKKDEKPKDDKKADDKKADDKKDAKKEDKKKDGPEPIKIDFEGLEDRLIDLNVPDGNYGNIVATKDTVFFAGSTSLQAQGFNIYAFDMKKREVKTVISGLNGASISNDGKKILVRQGRTMAIIDAKPNQKINAGRLNLSGLQMVVDYREEWKQVFNEAWRQARDYFYDRNHHGLDWNEMKERYGQLVEYCAHRDDLNYVIGELIGELNSSHTYRGGGEYPRIQNTGTGLLGADIVADAASGYYKIVDIYEGENWDPQRHGPLSVPGLNVNPGDYILAVNGKEVKYPENFYSHFVNAAGKVINITVGSEPDLEKGREIQVTPIGNDGNHRYMNWIMGNLEKVKKATDGRVGYIYLPDTAFGGMEWFNRMFYAQLHKDALIVDARFNSGGFIPNFFLERLARKLLNVWVTPYSNGFRTPGSAHYGPKICLTNRHAGSGGDAFPYYFRELGLGPVIGTRSWGGLIGISGTPPLMDNGSVRIADFSFVNTKGEWDVENKGITPDIVVENLPEEMVKGRDQQLERAIEEILKVLAEGKQYIPEMPTKFPVR